MSIAGSRRSSGHVGRAQTASRESLVRGSRRRWVSGAARRSGECARTICSWLSARGWRRSASPRSSTGSNSTSSWAVTESFWASWRLVIAHPFKERPVELQMLALYRCGRQADALTAFQAARGRFVDELGIEPAQPLRALHEDVLKHSAALSPPVDEAAERTVGAQLQPPMPSAFSDRMLPIP